MAQIGDVTTVVLLTPHMETMMDFYGRVLGFELNSLVSSPQYAEFDAEGVAIGISRTTSEAPAGRSMAIGIDVDSLEEATRRLEADGVTFVNSRQGPYVSIRSFQDPDGNLVSLIERHVP